MSEMNANLSADETKDVGAAIRKMFGDIPTIDRAKELERFKAEQIRLTDKLKEFSDDSQR